MVYNAITNLHALADNNVRSWEAIASSGETFDD